MKQGSSGSSIQNLLVISLLIHPCFTIEISCFRIERKFVFLTNRTRVGVSQLAEKS